MEFYCQWIDKPAAIWATKREEFCRIICREMRVGDEGFTIFIVGAVRSAVASNTRYLPINARIGDEMDVGMVPISRDMDIIKVITSWQFCSIRKDRSAVIHFVFRVFCIKSRQCLATHGAQVEGRSQFTLTLIHFTNLSSAQRSLAKICLTH